MITFNSLTVLIEIWVISTLLAILINADMKMHIHVFEYLCLLRNRLRSGVSVMIILNLSFCGTISVEEELFYISTYKCTGFLCLYIFVNTCLLSVFKRSKVSTVVCISLMTNDTANLLLFCM